MSTDSTSGRASSLQPEKLPSSQPCFSVYTDRSSWIKHSRYEIDPFDAAAFFDNELPEVAKIAREAEAERLAKEANDKGLAEGKRAEGENHFEDRGRNDNSRKSEDNRNREDRQPDRNQDKERLRDSRHTEHNSHSKDPRDSRRSQSTRRPHVDSGYPQDTGLLQVPGRFPDKAILQENGGAQDNSTPMASNLSRMFTQSIVSDTTVSNTDTCSVFEFQDRDISKWMPIQKPASLDNNANPLQTMVQLQATQAEAAEDVYQDIADYCNDSGLWTVGGKPRTLSRTSSYSSDATVVNDISVIGRHLDENAPLSTSPSTLSRTPAIHRDKALPTLPLVAVLVKKTSVIPSTVTFSSPINLTVKGTQFTVPTIGPAVCHPSEHLSRLESLINEAQRFTRHATQTQTASDAVTARSGVKKPKEKKTTNIDESYVLVDQPMEQESEYPTGESWYTSASSTGGPPPGKSWYHPVPTDKKRVRRD